MWLSCAGFIDELEDVFVAFEEGFEVRAFSIFVCFGVVCVMPVSVEFEFTEAFLKCC